MANLETLELTISANAESATQGIGQLTRSLSALSTAVGKSVGGLMKLNAELRTLKGFRSIKLPNVGKTTGAAAAKKAASDYNPLTNNNRAAISSAKRTPEGITYAQKYLTDRNTYNAGWNRKNEFAEKRQSLENAGYPHISKSALQAFNGASTAVNATAQANNTLAKSAETVATSTQGANAALKNNAVATQSAGKEANSAKSAFQALGETITRIAKTMMIRAAIRALIKNFTEAWQAVYQFSKNANGSFAKSIDSIKSSLKTMSINIIKAFAPLVNIIAPIINVIAQGIEYLCNAIQSLLKLLGFASELFGATAESIGKTSSSAKAATNVLAGFDELNVLQSGSGGGGGGGSKITSAFEEQISAIKILVAESLLAVGLILAFSGHIGVGLALAAVGAATIAGTIATKWGELSEKTKGEITTVMAIAGGAMLALGSVIAFSGSNIPLGIALMIAGAANMAAAVALSWGLSGEIKEQVGKVTAIVGGALLAIGAVLAFSGANVPLGIGMMAAGGVSLASSVALNWDSLKSQIVKTFANISLKLVNAWDTVKSAVSGAWGVVKNWAVSKWSDFKKNWEEIKKKLSDIWDKIEGSISDAWDTVRIWWETSGIGTKVTNAWSSARQYLYDAWDSVKTSCTFAWNKVKDWWEVNVSNKITNAWSAARQYLYGAWDSVRTSVSTAWDNVKKWWETTGIGTKVTNAWSEARQYLYGAWDSVKTSISTAWDHVKKWWETSGLKSKVNSAWKSAKDFLVNDIWTPIATAASNAWDNVCDFFGDIIGKVRSAWSGVKKWFEENVTDPINEAFKTVLNWCIGKLNGIINAFNKLGKFTIPKFEIFGKVLWEKTDVKLFEIPTIAYIKGNGDYNIPKGQVFIANEAGAEMVGSLDGHTAVANNDQIVEGIRRGIADGQKDQVELLRQQNELLYGILQKSGTLNFSANPMLGREIKKSLDMYGAMVGG